MIAVAVSFNSVAIRSHLSLWRSRVRLSLAFSIPSRTSTDSMVPFLFLFWLEATHWNVSTQFSTSRRSEMRIRGEKTGQTKWNFKLKQGKQHELIRLLREAIAFLSSLLQRINEWFERCVRDRFVVLMEIVERTRRNIFWLPVYGSCTEQTILLLECCMSFPSLYSSRSEYQRIAWPFSFRTNKYWSRSFWSSVLSLASPLSLTLAEHSTLVPSVSLWHTYCCLLCGRRCDLQLSKRSTGRKEKWWNILHSTNSSNKVENHALSSILQCKFSKFCFNLSMVLMVFDTAVAHTTQSENADSPRERETIRISFRDKLFNSSLGWGAH